jgi:uncharacterized protein (TIGR00369 family)
MEPKPVRESVTTMSMVMLPEDANPVGNVHGGVIMKQIDNCAAVVAMRHARTIGLTASIDRIDFHRPCYVGEVLTLKASLNLVGRTSMEIGVRVEAENPLTGDQRHIASAYLTFVALGPDRKPTPVPPLLPETDDEKRRFQEARNRREARLVQCGKSR